MSEAKHKSRLNFVEFIHDHKIYTQSWPGNAEAVVRLLEHRASLPAHRAKLAQGGAGKHACDLPGCVSCGNPPDTEGETRA